MNSRKSVKPQDLSTMDANQTKFHLLLGEADWSRFLSCNPIRSGPSGTKHVTKSGLRKSYFALSPNYHTQGPRVCSPDLSPRRQQVSLAMDANQTRFHLLLGEADWSRCTELQPDPFRTEWDKARYEVRLAGKLFRFVASKFDLPPRIERRRGAARDRYGNWYWISESEQEIRVSSAGTDTTAHFWKSGDGIRCERRGAGDFAAAETEQPCSACHASRPRGDGGSLPHRGRAASRRGCSFSICTPEGRRSNSSGRRGCRFRRLTWLRVRAAAFGFLTENKSAIGA